MKFKAIVYDTQNNKPFETVVNAIYCDKFGKPVRVTAHNGMQYREFELIETKPRLLPESEGEYMRNRNPPTQG
jgi:hypothetical protein